MLWSLLYKLGGACTDLLKSLFLLIPLETAFILFAKKRGYRISSLHITGVCFFELLLLLIFIITGIPSLKELLAHGFVIKPDTLNLIPFAYIKEDIFPYIANIILFIPFGLLCPLLWRCKRTFWHTVISGFFLSLLIEISQLFNFRVTDVDDLLMNTLGTAIGFLCFLLIRRIIPRISGKFALEKGGGFPTSRLLKWEPCLLCSAAFISSFVLLPYLACY